MIKNIPLSPGVKSVKVKKMVLNGMTDKIFSSVTDRLNRLVPKTVDL